MLFDDSLLIAVQSAFAAINQDVFLRWLAITGSIIFFLALISVPSVLMQRRGRPQAALTWVLALVMLPGLGLLFWWALGRQYLERKRRKRRRSTERRVDRSTPHQESALDTEESTNFFQVKYLPKEESEWVLPPTQGNHTKLLLNAAEAYPAMLEVIREAQKSIEVLFYIWQRDETGELFRDALVERARAGIQVRVLFDAVGASRVRKGFMQPLIDAGAQVAVFMPPKFIRWSLALNFRNHRKIVIADGAKAVIGGLNIGNEYTKNWIDIAVLLQGPVVDQIHEVFVDDWYFTTGDNYSISEAFEHAEAIPPEPGMHSAECGVIGSGPHTHINLMHETFFIAINQAKKRVWISTPYFIPSQSIMAALRAAVFRGVDVRVVVPAVSDSQIVSWAGRSYYEEMLRTGVLIYEYQPGFLHSKVAIIDQQTSIIGSANMDIRSFHLNFEISCVLKSPGLTDDLSTLFESYLNDSKEVTMAQLEERSYFMRLTESVAHLFSPLL